MNTMYFEKLGENAEFLDKDKYDKIQFLKRNQDVDFE